MAIINGTNSAETLNGTPDADLIYGLGGDDLLNGNGGDDLLDGGTGVDSLIGHLGSDTYVVDDAGDVATELAGEGFDGIQASVDYAIDAGASIEWLGTWGMNTTSDLKLYGNELNNTLLGNAGRNLLDGRGGADTMSGYAGDDHYLVDDAGDVVIESAGEGIDGIQTNVDYALAAGQWVEWLATWGVATTTNLRLRGNEIANQLIGNNGNNYLDGGAGSDRLIGFLGDDTYVVDNAGDVVTELAGEGFDSIQTTVDYAIDAGASIEWLGVLASSASVRLFGNEIDNIIVGNAGDDFLDGGAGADDLRGGRGDDWYIVDNAGDLVTEIGSGSGRDLSQGLDGVQTSVDYTLAPGQFVEFLGTFGVATTANLRLTGNERSQVLFGNNGDNFLDGKGGPDALRGYDGTDTFAFTTALIVDAAAGPPGLVDVILDFEEGLDKIGLDDAVFAGVTSGNLASAFVVGTQAQDADDRIIYDQAKGALYYDADGNGSAAAPMQFADLVTGIFGVPGRSAPDLAASDFIVI